jgi:hypothetical protein
MDVKSFLVGNFESGPRFLVKGRNTLAGQKGTQMQRSSGSLQRIPPKYIFSIKVVKL